ncbi:hypothetical protein [Candidatus Parabeggiatoa sp. HSG14]|uniref:hypothetical protein n=1 Tax=Candidatus Parabeggiatoa sp. HSG14 TaxID=3055593 RepID=UPI0025A742D5|nr:hypothetical protein [Thiotrichales bacterium HSG14]
MLSIRGIYTGKEIKPLENIPVQPNVQVIITFLELDKMNQKINPKKTDISKSPTQLFLDKCGGWKDTRCPKDIITEIYASRTSSERVPQLF